jgi:hypothetical protein
MRDRPAERDDYLDAKYARNMPGWRSGPSGLPGATFRQPACLAVAKSQCHALLSFDCLDLDAGV